MKRLVIILLTLPLSFLLQGCISQGSSQNGRSLAANEPALPYESHLDEDVEPDDGELDLPVRAGETARSGLNGKVDHFALFDWPVNEARMTRGFFLKPKKRRGRPHLGIDLAAPKGTPIYAAHDGLVIYVGREFKGYGRMIMVEGKNGFASLYAHLSKSLIRTGAHVTKGDLLGEMGRTGRATGVHLHFEIRMKDGPVDPLTYLPGGDDLSKEARSTRRPLWIPALFDLEPPQETAQIPGVSRTQRENLDPDL